MIVLGTRLDGDDVRHRRRAFYAARVVLGIAEAGFFPGMVLYLTYWIPAAERARTGALFMMAAPIAIIVGAPVSEAHPVAARARRPRRAGSGCFCSKGCRRSCSGAGAGVLTDRPEQARVARAGQRGWLCATMAAERAQRGPRHGHGSVFAGFTSAEVWLLAACYFINTLVTYGVFLWLPKILQDLSGSAAGG